MSKKDPSKSTIEKTAKAQPTQKDTLKKSNIEKSSGKTSGNKEDVIDSYEPMENLSDTSMSDYQAQLPANIEQVGIEDLIPQKHRQSEKSKRVPDREKTKKPAVTIKTTPKAAEATCPKSCKTQQTYAKTLAAQPTQKTHKTPTGPDKTSSPPVNPDKTQAITKKSAAESKKASEPKGAASVTAATGGKGAASTQKGATEISVAESKGAATTQGPTTATSVAAKSVQPEKTQKTAAPEQKQQSIAQEIDLPAEPSIAANPETKERKKNSCCVVL